MIEIATLDAPFNEKDLHDLADITRATVADGGAISFMQPFELSDGLIFWRDAIAPQVGKGELILFAARSEGAFLGTVSLVLALPPNQPHRAEIAKMMVHPAHRRKGVGRLLIDAALDRARAEGRTLVTLDTRTGDAAQRLYAAAGFTEAGEVPGFAYDPEGASLHGTTYMFRTL